MSKYDCLKIENQLCFPLYACAKEIVRKYRPFLSKYDLTYTQYIVMMVLWDEDKTNVTTLGERVYLDSGTLTPVLKKLESKGLIIRKRAFMDERNRVLELTEKGKALQDEVKNVPEEMRKCMALEKGEAETLYKLLYKILGNIE
ncbi:MAG: MarR family transcriptional regulator [Eubacterium sp.]|nr:MarR family transcriptional regulator [Eubacterium sp.]